MKWTEVKEKKFIKLLGRYSDADWDGRNRKDYPRYFHSNESEAVALQKLKDFIFEK